MIKKNKKYFKFITENNSKVIIEKKDKKYNINVDFSNLEKEIKKIKKEFDKNTIFSTPERIVDSSESYIKYLQKSYLINVIDSISINLNQSIISPTNSYQINIRNISKKLKKELKPEIKNLSIKSNLIIKKRNKKTSLVNNLNLGLTTSAVIIGSYYGFKVGSDYSIQIAKNLNNISHFYAPISGLVEIVGSIGPSLFLGSSSSNIIFFGINKLNKIIENKYNRIYKYKINSLDNFSLITKNILTSNKFDYNSNRENFFQKEKEVIKKINYK